jgi:CubicO group peptidase (beta-lactamase class C family)
MTPRAFAACFVAMLGAVVPACIFDEKLKHDYGVVPQALDDGWEIATPESVGLSSDTLAQIHAELLREDRFVGSLGMLVVKDGKLVWETYLRTPADRDHVHHIQSATKSVTSVLFGMVRDDGLVGSADLDRTIGDLFPDKMSGLDPAKQGITLRELLTMRSGIAFDNSDFSGEMYTDKPNDQLRYILDKPLYAPPGTRFYYRDADPQIVGYAMQRLTGITARAFAAARLFAPLGITDYDWESAPDGTTMAPHGLHLRPRDLAKFGQLVLDGGTWRGTRLVSKDWIDQSTSAQVTSLVNGPNGTPYPFGYYWWITSHGASAWGHGGQYVLIVPPMNMVLVHIALPDTNDMDGDQLNDFLRLVKPLFL